VSNDLLLSPFTKGGWTAEAVKEKIVYHIGFYIAYFALLALLLIALERVKLFKPYEDAVYASGDEFLSSKDSQVRGEAGAIELVEFSTFYFQKKRVFLERQLSNMRLISGANAREYLNQLREAAVIRGEDSPVSPLNPVENASYSSVFYAYLAAGCCFG
jgi:hypothetical protein